jgi:Ca2+-binding RTX toxin-like protein
MSKSHFAVMASCAKFVVGVALGVNGGQQISNITGTSGNDVLNGSSGNDTIDASQGGNDIIDAGAGDDQITFGAAFTGADSVDGGTGSQMKSPVASVPL